MVTAEVTDKGAYPPVISQSKNENGNTVNNGNDFYSLIGRPGCASCPDARFHGAHPQDRKPITAYGANPMIMGNSQNNNPPLVRPAQITRPAEVILLADGAQFGLPNPRAIGFSAGWWLNRNGNPADAEKKLTTAIIPASGFWGEESLMPMRHNGKANVIFCDGHAASIKGIGELKEKNLYWNY
jgi:prepilin-type processing-associated H-X9-DG protein